MTYLSSEEAQRVRDRLKESRITGRVTGHAPFGFFLDIAEQVPGHVPIHCVADNDQPVDLDDFPAVGTLVQVRFLDIRSDGSQIWLDARPSRQI